MRDELCALAQTHIDAWDSYADREFRSNEYGFEFTSRQTDYAGVILTVSKACVPGLTLEQHQYFRENLVSLIPKIDSKISVTDCPDFEGCRAVVQHIKMPMFMDNRVIPQIYYFIENEDGSIVFLASSKDTDGFKEAQKAVMKKDVEAINHINYTKLTPTANGCDWVSVQCLDIAGSIPDMLKNSTKERQAKAALQMIQLIKTREAPA